MGSYSKSGDAIMGSFIFGKARKITPRHYGELLYPDKNREQYELTRKTKRGSVAGIRSECWIKHESKVIIRRFFKRLKIHDQKGDMILGNDLYCECKRGISTGKKGKRFLKMLEVHGQGYEFTGDGVIAVVIKEFIQSPSFTLSKYVTLEEILRSKE